MARQSERMRKVTDLETAVAARRDVITPIPTWCFFVTERHQAAANYDNAPAETVVERVEAVDSAIRLVDEARRANGWDTIDTAVFLQRQGCTVSIVEAAWHRDRATHGEAYAWKHQLNPDHIDQLVSTRASSAAS